ncbi:glycosyl hydrolase family 28-related protein [Nonomuraea sp. NPDC050540]|uniref:right-handed parallel beta-helix repeat-containing protein n=1 Tax=Nonomuraea sp. NPDC050540 TaxID=3364367 RepID=UPI00379DB31C
MTEHPAPLSRRGALAAIAVPGVAAALLPGTAHAAAVPEGLPATTLDQLKLVTAAPAATHFYVTDPGKEGVFSYRGSSTAVDDNGATVLVSNGGQRFLRIFDGPLNVRWFGAVGDNVKDDSDAIQAAVTAAQSLAGAVVYLPTGKYLVGKTIVIDSAKAPIRIVGDGFGSDGALTQAKYTLVTAPATPPAGMEAVFAFTLTENVVGNRYEFSDLTVDGGGRVPYGIKALSVAHTLFRRILVKRTATAGLYIGNGWCNDVETCEFSSNSGDGIRVGAASTNAFNVTNTKIFDNAKIGINLDHSCLGVRINGCTIEDNLVAGIFVRFYVSPLQIVGNYFENNGTTGYTFTDPARTVKASVIVNGSGTAGVVNTAYPVGTIRFADNVVAPTTAEHIVVCYSADAALEISGTTVLRYQTTGVARYVLLKTGTNRTGGSGGAKVNGVLQRGNAIWSPHAAHAVLDPIEIDELGSASTTTFHTALIDGVAPVNYAPPLSGFVMVGSAGGGTWAAAATTHRRQAVFTLNGAGDTDYFGFPLDLAANPELAGKYVYFACYLRVDAAGTGGQLWDNVLHAGAVTHDTAWRLVSYVDRLPATGVVKFGVRKLSAGTLRVAAPVLSELGAPYQNHLR